jgi:hypothetical protein
MAAKQKKVTVKTIRENRGKDMSPLWDGHENWSLSDFKKTYYDAMNYYNIETSPKDVKSIVLRWMNSNDFDPIITSAFKKTKDWRCPTTMSSLIKCLSRGMPEAREDFNQGRNMKDWLVNKINQIIEDGKLDYVEDDEPEQKPIANIQDRIYEISLSLCDEIEQHIDNFTTSPDTWDPKDLKIASIFKIKNVKSSHAKIIKEHYAKTLAELEELASGEVDEQLKEAYKCYSKRHTKKMIEFLKELDNVCATIINDAITIKKPRVKKPVSKEKVVEKLNYKKLDEKLNLTSISPTNLVGAKEVWIFDTKTRKLYQYFASENDGPISVKGSALIGFDENKSIGKTLLKPMDELAKFRVASSALLKKFMENVNTLEIKASGKITEHQIILKTVS